MPSATDSAAHVGDFDVTIPTVGTTTVSQLDDFIRHVKTVLKTDFAAVTGAVTSSHTELNVLDGIPGTLTATELGYVDGVTSAIQTQLNLKAPLASPTFTGVPAAPTAAGGTSTTQVATTEFVTTSFATKASPTFTGVPAAPTAAAGTNTTQVATTEFVVAEVKGAWDLIVSTATGAGATLDLIHGSGGVVIDSTYDVYMLELIAVKPATDNDQLLLRTTTNASTFDAGASDYQYQASGAVGGVANVTQNTTTAIALTAGASVGTAAGENGVYGSVMMFAPSAAAACVFAGQLAFKNNSGNLVTHAISGVRETAANVDGVRFLWNSAGNFASGTVNLYGRRK